MYIHINPIYLHVYMHTYIQKYTHKHKHEHKHTHTQYVYMCAYMHVYIVSLNNRHLTIMILKNTCAIATTATMEVGMGEVLLLVLRRGQSRPVEVQTNWARGRVVEMILAGCYRVMFAGFSTCAKMMTLRLLRTMALYFR